MRSVSVGKSLLSEGFREAPSPIGLTKFFIVFIILITENVVVLIQDIVARTYKRAARGILAGLVELQPDHVCNVLLVVRKVAYVDVSLADQTYSELRSDVRQQQTYFVPVWRNVPMEDR